MAAPKRPTQTPAKANAQKVTVQNTRLHPITLNLRGDDDVIPHVVTIPAARQSTEDRNRVIPGTAEVPVAQLDKGKSDPVIGHYFEHGWLSQVDANEPDTDEDDK